MDRPVLLLKHLRDGSVLLAVEHPDMEGGPIRIDRDGLVNELAFPRRHEMDTWLRLPAAKVHLEISQEAKGVSSISLPVNRLNKYARPANIVQVGPGHPLYKPDYYPPLTIPVFYDDE